MKYFLCLPTVVLACFGLVACSTTDDYGDCNEDKLNYYGERKVFKEDGTGTEQIHLVLITCQRGSHRLYKYGATTANGKVLIEPTYKSVGNILPFSDKRALVLVNENGFQVPKIFHYATKQYESTNAYNVLASGSKDDVAVVLGSIRETPATSDALLFSPFTEQPRRIKGIGGKGYAQLFAYSNPSAQPIHRWGDVIITNYITDDGRKASQILNLTGDPITPLTNQIELLQFYSSDTQLKERTFHRQLVTKISDKVSDDFSTFGLYLPLDNRGQFIKLPKGVIGLSPTPHYGWMVFIDSKGGGLETAYFKTANLSGLDDSILNLPRYKKIVPHRIKGYDWEFVLAQKSDNKWIFLNLATATPKTWPNALADYPTRESVEKDFYAFLDSEYKKLVAQKEVERRRAEQEKMAQKEAMIVTVQKAAANNHLCIYKWQVIQVGQPYVDQYLQQCPIYTSEDITQLSLAGASPEALRQAEIKWGQKIASDQQYARELVNRNNVFLNAMKAPVQLGPIANPGTPSQQQQNYRMERDVNRQIFNKSWDPYK